MEVRIPSPLRSYTGSAVVQASGGTIGQVLAELDDRFPGLRFRVVDEQGRLRDYMNVFIGTESVRDLATEVPDGEVLTIMQALAGG